jgi:rare lipoprotein A
MRQLFIILPLLFSLAACAGNKAIETGGNSAFSERGKASFYASKYQARKTASGERLNNNAMTAAHKTLPFGTKVRVTNVRNGRYVDVIINDRGPFVKGRIIDLTQAAFSRIEDMRAGLADVKVVVVR